MEKISEVATFQGFGDPPFRISELAQTFKMTKPISLTALLERANALANINTMTQILESGEAGTKINLAVLGDGFAAGDDQTIYNNAVKDLLLHGVFSNDFFLENKSVFNIYRVNLISKDSGVGTKTYSRDANDICQEDSTLISTVTKNTALGIYANGCWGRCWHNRRENTDALKEEALDYYVPDYDYVLIILNSPLFAGCGGDREAIVSPSGGWGVIAHEFGHSMGGLGDEYCENDEYNGDEPEEVNVTINTNRDTLKWKSYITDPTNTPIPTGKGPCVTKVTEGTQQTTWDTNQSVGLFEGAYTFKRGVYRPVISCRMKDNDPPFCPVCHDQMKSQIDDFKKSVDTENAASFTDTSAGYVRFKVHVENGKLSITGVKDIPGKLITPRTASPGHFYEVLIGDEPISLGFLPDVGVRRSYASSNELRVKLREHKSTQPSFDFFVRIPRAKVTEDTLPKMAVMVHRVQRMPVKLDRSIPFIKNPGIVSTEIGHLKGVKLNKLPKQVRPQLERILKENLMQ